MKHFPNWLSILAKATVFFGVLIISNLALIYFFGPQIWSFAGYFFGDNSRITLGVLMFVEGGVLLALGSLWSSGSFENVRYGKYRKSFGSFSKEDWEERRKQTENPGNVIKILLIVGSFTLVASFALILI